MALVIGVIIALWLLIGLQNLGKWNTVAAVALLIAGVYLNIKYLIHGSAPSVSSGQLSFGAALELAIAMPLSWVAIDWRLY